MEKKIREQLTNLDTHLVEAFNKIDDLNADIENLKEFVIELDNKIHNLKQVMKCFIKMPDETEQLKFEKEVNTA